MRLNATLFTQEVEDAQWSVIRGNSAYTELHSMTHEGLQVNVQAFVTPSTILSINALQTDSTFDTETGTAVASTALMYTYYQGSQSVDPHNPTQATAYQTYTAAQMVGQLAAVKTSIDNTCESFPALEPYCAQVAYATDGNNNWFINPTGLVQPMIKSCLKGNQPMVLSLTKIQRI